MPTASIVAFWLNGWGPIIPQRDLVWDFDDPQAPWRLGDAVEAWLATQPVPAFTASLSSASWAFQTPRSAWRAGPSEE